MTKKSDPERLERLRKYLQHTANSSRDTADEMAAMFGGCDDPMHPWNFPGEFRDWLDFVDRVARPLIDAQNDDDEAGVQAAMKLYRTVNPQYICIAMVMMAERIKAWEEADKRAWPFGHLCVDCGQLEADHPFRRDKYACDVWRDSGV